MKANRRKFISNVVAGGLGASAMGLPSCTAPEKPAAKDQLQDRYAQLDGVLAQPIFKHELFPDPVIIESVELLRYGNSFICRVRSKDGAEGFSASHHDMRLLYPIFLNNLKPFSKDRTPAAWTR